MRFLSLLSLAAGAVLAYAAYLFFGYNRPIIKNYPLLVGMTGAVILAIFALSVRDLLMKNGAERRNRLSGLLLILAAVLLVKGMTMGMALIAMIIGQVLAGVQVGMVESVVFSGIAITALIFTVLMLRSVQNINTSPHSA